jgi:hypothetical protein
MGREPPVNAPNKSISVHTHITVSGIVRFGVGRVALIRRSSGASTPHAITTPHLSTRSAQQLGKLRFCPFSMFVFVIEDLVPP